MSRVADFDWDNDADIVVREQAAITVYTNARGDIVIRQAGQYGPDEDTCVVVTPENSRKLADAIVRIAGVESVTPSTTSATKPMTNAERQRAYRERQRNAAVTPVVTERDAEPNGGANTRDD